MDIYNRQNKEVLINFINLLGVLPCPYLNLKLFNTPAVSTNNGDLFDNSNG